MYSTSLFATHMERLSDLNFGAFFDLPGKPSLEFSLYNFVCHIILTASLSPLCTTSTHYTELFKQLIEYCELSISPVFTRLSTRDVVRGIINLYNTILKHP